MSRFYLTVALISIGCYALAQRALRDTIPTNAEPVVIQPILHGSLVLEWNNEVIYFDPYGGEEAFVGIKDPTLIYITDIHGDHLNLKTLNSLNTDQAKFVVPEAVAKQLPGKYTDQVIVLNNGETRSINDIPTVALPMYNLPESSDSRHVKGRGNGYILNLGGKNFYISGDTEDIPEMRSLRNIYVAFVCMNLPYTMSVEQAADAVLEFKPGIVYPFHYRGKGGLSDVEMFKNLVKELDENIEVRLRNWYPEY